ncbi:MAG: hypothetical protein ACPGUV_06190 [Polyangiales bacterium]
MPGCIHLAACALLLGACSDVNGVSLFIDGNVIPKLQDDGCELDVDNTVLVPPGSFNVQFNGFSGEGSGYSVYPRYTNQVRGRSTELSADPNTIFITEAEIELRRIDGAPIAFGALANPFTIRTSTVVPSGVAATGGAQTPGQQVGALTIIPDSYRQLLPASGEVEAGVRVRGRTSGGRSIRSEEWTWQVSLCGGNCLFNCIPATEVSTTSCTPGQDSVAERAIEQCL